VVVVGVWGGCVCGGGCGGGWLGGVLYHVGGGGEKSEEMTSFKSSVRGRGGVVKKKGAVPVCRGSGWEWRPDCFWQVRTEKEGKE